MQGQPPGWSPWVGGRGAASLCASFGPVSGRALSNAYAGRPWKVGSLLSSHRSAFEKRSPNQGAYCWFLT